MINVVCQRANVCADEMLWGNQPIKSMMYGAVVGNRPCGCSPNNLRYVNLLPEALMISLKALWCLWPTLSPPVLLFPEALHFVWRPLCAQVPHLKGRCECGEGCEHLLHGMNPKLCLTGVWEATSDDSGTSLASSPAADGRMRGMVGDGNQQQQRFSRSQEDHWVLAPCSSLFTHRPNVD